MTRKPLSADLLKRYLAKECTEQERHTVDEWYRSLDQRAEDSPNPFDQETLKQRIYSRIREEEATRVLPLKRWWRYAGTVATATAAAVVLIAWGLGYLSGPKEAVVAPPALTEAESQTWTEYKNEQKKVVRYSLPDNSVVWLHPGARLSHPQTFEGVPQREVRFVGEGFFDVARDSLHPFVIYSGKLTTQVLGTSFNVRAYEQDPTYHVSVVSGSVAVSAPASATKKMETLVLKPNQQATFRNSTSSLAMRTVQEKVTSKETWQPVSLTFDDAPLSEVVVRLQKTFRIKIEMTNARLRQCRLKVDFNHQRLPEILEMINTLLGTTYEMEGEKIFLSGEGC